MKVRATRRSSVRIASRRRRIFPPIKRRKDTICILLRASTFLLRRLLDLISEDSFHPHSVLSSPSRLRYGRNSRASCAKTDGHSSRIPRRRRHLESTEYAAMDSMEGIREGVRRRYIAASSRARLIRESDDCNGEISSPKLDSKFKRLVAALVAAFDFHSGGLSRRHLGIRRRWISARFTSNFASTPSSAAPRL